MNSGLDQNELRGHQFFEFLRKGSFADNLNFNDEFEFNTIGVEGYLGQLMQIVYTATAFPTVDSVQILISGEKKDYLGSEGVWIGSPLARSSFR